MVVLEYEERHKQVVLEAQEEEEAHNPQEPQQVMEELTGPTELLVPQEELVGLVVDRLQSVISQVLLSHIVEVEVEEPPATVLLVLDELAEEVMGVTSIIRPQQRLVPTDSEEEEEETTIQVRMEREDRE